MDPDLGFLAPEALDPYEAVLGDFLARIEREEAKGPAMTLAELRERYRDDFLGFCRLLEIIPKETGAGPVPFEPNEIQLLYCAERSARDIVLKARQIGLTTIEQARDVWFFLTRPSASVKVVCQSISDHSARNGLSKRFDVMFAALRRRGVALAFEAEAVGRWKLGQADGAAVLEIVEAGASAAAAEKKGRSDTVHRLHVTEVAFFEYASKTLNAMIECVSKPEDGSEIIFESTPNGAGPEDLAEVEDAAGGPYFYAKCQSARKSQSGYKFFFFSWMDKADYRLPLEPGEVVEAETERERQIVQLGASPEQLKWYKRKLRDDKNNNQDLMDQEYPSDPQTCFLVSGRGVFDKTITQGLIAAARDPLGTLEIRRNGAVGICKIFHLPEPDERYVVAGDTSEGTGGDRGGAQVYEAGSGRHCATLWGQFKPKELARDLDCLGALYNDACIAVERNNHGHACLQALEDLGYPSIFTDHDDKLGWLNVETKRTKAIDDLEQAHRSGEWTTLDRDILGEFRTFIVNKDGRAEGARGAHDDLVIMAAIAWDVLRRLPPPVDYWSLRARGGRGGMGARRGRR